MNTLGLLPSVAKSYGGHPSLYTSNETTPYLRWPAIRSSVAQQTIHLINLRAIRVYTNEHSRFIALRR